MRHWVRDDPSAGQTTSDGVEVGACRECGVVPPAGANFCPECGSPCGAELADTLTTSASPEIQTPASMRSRLGMLLGLLAVTGLVAFLWVLAPGDDPSGEGGESPSPAQSSTPPSTTIEPSTTVSTDTAPTTTAPSVLFVNDTPGPVIDEGITGTLIGLGRRALYRVDLATGRVDTVELQRGFSEDYRRVIVGDLLIWNSWGGTTNIFTTDLRNGEQEELALPEGTEWGEVVGQAGPESFWLSGERIVYEMDVTGTVIRQVDIPEPFWVSWARDHILFLGGPDGLYAYDTITGEATEVDGSIQFASSPLLMRCDESLDCRVFVLTETGEVEVPGVSVARLSGWATETVAVSPDQTAALYRSWDEYENGAPPTITYIDLVSGERIDFGGPDVDLWIGAAWIPDTRWVVVRPLDGTTFLTALNTETGQGINLDIPRQSVLNPEFGVLVYEPAAG